MSSTTAPVEPGIGEERRTTPVELLWDLVFVFAITQVTRLMSLDLSWRGFGRGMLVLALVWWAWSAFVWAANAQASDSSVLRASLLLASVCIFISGLALPRAFGSQATLFAGTYAAVRLLHLALYADASRRGNASWSAIAGFGVTVVIGMALLIAGSFTSGPPRASLWGAAVLIDYAGPAWLTRERLRGLQRVAVAHFAERYSLFVIICLGESIVTIGVATRNQPLTVELVSAVALGLLITIGMWWTYFDRFAGLAEERLRAHEDPVLAASDAYSYIHILIVAGIIIFAVGVNSVVHSAGHSLNAASRLALCGGVGIYLLGHVAFRLRMVGTIGHEKIVASAGLFVLYAASPKLTAWATTAAIAALMAMLCLLETMRDRRLRAAEAITSGEADNG